MVTKVGDLKPEYPVGTQIPFEVRVVKNFDAVGQYCAEDVMSDDICTTTSPAEYWIFGDMAKKNGGFGRIEEATLILDTEGQTPRIDLILFNAIPTGVLTDNLENTNPVKGDKAKWVGTIEFPATRSDNAAEASNTRVSPSTVGGLPLKYKCAVGSTTLYGITVTRDDVTLTANDDCAITLKGDHL